MSIHSVVNVYAMIAYIMRIDYAKYAYYLVNSEVSDSDS